VDPAAAWVLPVSANDVVHEHIVQRNGRWHSTDHDSGNAAGKEVVMDAGPVLIDVLVGGPPAPTSPRGCSTGSWRFTTPAVEALEMRGRGE
jgi:hypothetical protein